MGISVSGLASGLDVDGIINQLLAIESQQLIVLNQKVGILEGKKAAYSDLDGRLSSLNNAVKNLNDDSLFGALSASSSDTSIVTVTAEEGAPAGNYSLQVLQLATEHRLASQGFVDDSATAVAVGDGTFEFEIGDGNTVTVDVTNSTTLRQLADAINDKDAGVRADIVNDGTLSNPYRLVLTASAEGDDGRITISNNDTTLDFANTNIEAAVADPGNAADYTGVVTSSGAYTGSDNNTYIVEIITAGAADGTAKFRYSTDGGLNFVDNGGAGFDVTSAGPIALANGVEINFTDDGTDLQVDDAYYIDVFTPELQTPQDAIININGINVRKSTNEIDDVFDGLTFNLQSADVNKTVSLSVVQDGADLTNQMSAFLGSYNALVGFLNAQFSFDPNSNAPAPPLNGDSAARQIQRTVRNILTSRIGQLGSSDGVSSLAEIGIESNEETGLVSLDSTKLDTLLKENPTAVRRLLTQFGEAIDGAGFTFESRTSETEPGTYDVEIDTARTRAVVEAGIAAENLTADETITFTLDTDAQNPASNPVQLVINLLNGDTPAQQVTRIQDALDGVSMKVTAFLNADGEITLRSNEYGEDFEVTAVSDRLAGLGLGTSGISNVVLTDEGTDLAGTIGGLPAIVQSDGVTLKGSTGFTTEGLEIKVPNDTSGDLGQVRIVDGLGESLPTIIKQLGLGDSGILQSRRDGVNRSIDDIEEQIRRGSRRTAQVEQRLRRQFTNLEVQIAQLNALGDYVTQQMAALSASSNRKK